MLDKVHRCPHMSVSALLLAVLSLYSCFSLSACPPHKVTEPSQVKLESDSVMIVVHASSTYDARFSAKRGIDEAVAFAKSKGIPVVYLQDDSPEQFYFTEDCAPNYWVYSEGGEISFDILASHVYIVGGHLELCMSTALHAILFQWAKTPPRNREVTYLMDAIYSNGRQVEPSDPFYGNFERFLNVVTYGRPAGEHWPKLSLLETMGTIVRENDELEYLTKVLPRWDRTFSNAYRVQVRLNHSMPKVLRSAEGQKPPTVQFHFIDSAVNLSSPFCTAGFRVQECNF
jgi:hypothetical protein